MLKKILIISMTVRYFIHSTFYFFKLQKNKKRQMPLKSLVQQNFYYYCMCTTLQTIFVFHYSVILDSILHQNLFRRCNSLNKVYLPECLFSSIITSFHPLSSPVKNWVVLPLVIGFLTPHICWNCTLISLNVSVITAMKTFFTSQAKKNIIVLEKIIA